MVKIIFSRIGKKKQPHYRIIALDKQKDPWGKTLEILGSYNPRSNELIIEKDRIEYWISQGAQPSATVTNLLISNNIISGKKRSVSTISKKRQGKLETETKEKAEKAATKQAMEQEKEQKPAEEEKQEKTEPITEPIKEEIKKEEKVEEKTETPVKEEIAKPEETK
ncbi:30S ribosomal protein S16 [Candidatus Falkowbacteria bacterium RIFOXYD2_FULL_35_9]|uniref:Small ribosomal subunit protein bS16 n=1 Tax=Candidatus Falkowbacteria bacterium RIFOXYC2_FULL_36_12 TaxID=1798002 RepID=A0A1F5T454_9BACT|nr:MAG: 30S ribosomal protein S16 [Candidatus Falkowbacteria bacterium RIFOXYB2_FULL_35_7]OGF33496.1 MAG: 30S ribosomal protein S16 [Candidatus Falkowbacteria bacterium RIFOXYC2_FULL_36_12]OGF33546.1 MAG: 30S ribosomal protein S16 [Candidatus Falkowbacteria bacterium RIFOXYA2_FULL_35_8]OGF47764.1 MAG: 30S ribosomal protein S16 [Candidatus Falkowbacteria bacterium RIFOXYD2_FULL_35_9]